MTRRARAAAAALVLLSGCVLPMRGTRVGRPVKEAAGRIVAGATTREELLRLLGPPMAVARRGEYVSVPAASSVPASRPYVQQADGWLEPFAARRPLLDDHRVYYWYFVKEGGTRVLVPLILVLVWSESRASSMEELWVLVDERTGVVDDLVRR